MALFDTVKTHLRITHDDFDAEIADVISEAKAEMERAGVSGTAIVDTDPLIACAVKTYARYRYAEHEKDRDGYFVSWQYQLGNLRASEDYTGIVLSEE
jgi:uncharacterized phage protein (predicted DNA packaging)